jgi:hypothetical protein
LEITILHKQQIASSTAALSRPVFIFGFGRAGRIYPTNPTVKPAAKFTGSIQDDLLIKPFKLMTNGRKLR